MAKFEELYDKYAQILKIEDEYKQDDALYDLNEELFSFICYKYPELGDIAENLDLTETIDTCTTERMFIEEVIHCMSNDDIICNLTTVNINNVIKNYIDDHI